jgi:hypothetical protein
MADKMPWCIGGLQYKRPVTRFPDGTGTAMCDYLISGPFPYQCCRVKLKSSLGFDPLLKDLQGNKSKLDFIVDNTTSLKYSEQYKVREERNFTGNSS